ncbi:23541_t:CDS:2, partial [Gigaspora rosea]
QHTINWQRMLELLNSYSDSYISNIKIDGINQWLISNSKNPDSWQIINRIQFTPLYKFLGVTLRKEIKIILSNEKRILMTGVSKLKNNKIRFRRIKFPQHLQSDDYQVIGFSAVIEDLHRESEESDDGNLEIYWQLIGNPMAVKYFSKQNRNIR